MGYTTHISWCHHTWSPWHGCAKISPGCDHCYAALGASRNPGVLGIWGEDGTRVLSKNWSKPRAWDRAAVRERVRRRVFPSICDPFEDRAELVGARKCFLALIAATPRLDWLVLTKRPEVAQRWFRSRNQRWAATAAYRDLLYGKDSGVGLGDGLSHWPPRNLWLGVSVEDQARAEERIPILLDTPAAIRWLSVEPLLGPVDLREAGAFGVGAETCHRGSDHQAGQCDCLPGVDWVVIGGESGAKARRCEIVWIENLVHQCRLANLPVYVKQLGSRSDTRLVHPKGQDLTEWPEVLRVQEFPRMETTRRHNV